MNTHLKEQVGRIKGKTAAWRTCPTELSPGAQLKQVQSLNAAFPGERGLERNTWLFLSSYSGKSS
jgi:hypothetical protein